MRRTNKRVFLTTVLLSSLLFLGLPSSNLVFAGGNPETAAQTAEAEAKALAEAKAATEAEAKAKAENMGNVAEPPSGPDVNIETIEEKIEIDTPASVTGQKFEGTGTVTDFSTSGSKAFYTITDRNSQVYYLIIDLDKTANNVYFLSDINKSELEGDTEIVAPIPEPQVESAVVEEPKESGSGFLLFVLLLAGVGVAAYYFLVMKKKHAQGNTDDDDEDDENMDNYEDDTLEIGADDRDDK